MEGKADGLPGPVACVAGTLEEAVAYLAILDHGTMLIERTMGVESPRQGRGAGEGSRPDPPQG